MPKRKGLPGDRPLRAAIYARISLDRDGKKLGVARQLDDCRKLASDRGWEIAGEYVDNDVSATRSRRRPEYEQMLDEVEAGRVDAIVAWDLDRLTRKPR